MAKPVTSTKASTKDKDMPATQTNGNGNGTMSKGQVSTEKHTGTPLNSKVEGALLRPTKSGKTKAYLPPIATRQKMLTFARTILAKTSKRLKIWSGENSDFAPIAKQIDSAITAVESANISLEKFPRGWEPTRTVGAANVGGFTVDQKVRIREKRQSQYSDVLDADAVKQTMTVTKVGKTKIVVKAASGMSAVITKSHLIDSNIPLEKEREDQAKADAARKAKKEADAADTK